MQKKKNFVETKLKSIKLIVCDVDGVLTDGRIYLTGGPEEIKVFNNRDAMRLEAAMRSGLYIVWLTGRKCAAVIQRSKEIIGGVNLIFKSDIYATKSSFLEIVEKKYNVKPEEIMYVGDDWGDLYLMNKVGLAVTPSNGSAENKKIADIVTVARGGEGVAAEIIEMVMRAKGTWEKYTQEYISQFIY